MTKATATLRQFALQKKTNRCLLSPATLTTPSSSSPTSGGYLLLSRFRPLPRALSPSSAAPSSPSIWCGGLVFCLWPRMIENALLLRRPRSGGEHSGTRTNKKCHLLRGALAHTGGMSASVCARAFVCVLAPFFMPTGGRHLIGGGGGGGRKTGQYVGANMCRRYETFLIYPRWQNHRASHLTVQPAIAGRLGQTRRGVRERRRGRKGFRRTPYTWLISLSCKCAAEWEAEAAPDVNKKEKKMARVRRL